MEVLNAPVGEEDANYEEKNDSEDEREDTDYEDEKEDTENEEYFSFHKTEILSLQNCCLKSIVTNFERFSTAYATTEDTTLRRNLLFLQRAYSDRMILEVSSKGHLNDSCLKFLLNEHLKELHLEMLSQCSEEAVVKQIAEIGHGLVKGYLNDGHFMDFFNNDGSSLLKRIVSHVPNISILHVEFVCNDEILQTIASGCPHLQELYVDASCVTEKGVKSFFVEKDGVVQVRCPLKTLSLKETKVEATGIAYLLENMPSLEVVTHHHIPSVLYTMHSNDMKNNTLNTARKYNLTSLDISYYQTPSVDLSDLLTICTRVCPHVKKLGTYVLNEKHLDLISLFSELENLTLKGPEDGDFLDLNNFLVLHGEKIKELKLIRYFSFTATVLLRSCPNLESLNLSDTVFAGKKENTCSTYRLKHLRELYLENFIFAHPSTELSVGAILNSSPKLELLDLSHCELADSDINTKLNDFCANNTLQSLHFKCSDVSVILLESILLSCSSLTTLVIQDCDNILADDIDSLYNIVYSKKNVVNIVWTDERSELNSIDDDFFDYDFADDSDDPYADYNCYDDYDYLFDEDDCGSDF